MIRKLFGMNDPFMKIVNAGDTRKRKADHWMNFYNDRQADRTMAILREHFPGNRELRKFMPVTVNMVRKITNARATIYRDPPRREFVGWDQAKGDALYRGLNANVALKRAARMVKLLKAGAVQVTWDAERNQPALAVITANILDTVHRDPEYPDRLIITHKADRPEDVTYSDWTSTAFTRRDFRGHPISNPTNPDGVNPYAALPFVPLFDRFPDSDFFLTGGDDLIEAQEAVNVALSNLQRTAELQAHGQPYATGLKPGDQITIGPDRAVILPDGASFGFAAPNAPIDDILEHIQFVMRQTAAANDVSADVFDLSKTAESGSAKEHENRALLEARQDDIDLWRAHEDRLFETVKIVVNAHAPGTIPDAATVRVDFKEYRETLSEGQRLDNYAKAIEVGIASPVDAFLREHPDFNGSREEAFAELARRRTETDELGLIL